MSNALDEFCLMDKIPDEHKSILDRLMGRGYSPPVTVEKWRELYQIIINSGALDDDTTAVNLDGERP